MPGFVTFESLQEGDCFFARGKFHCKSEVGIFKQPHNEARSDYNAFYFDGPTGTWTHFEAPALVQIYDENIHGQTAEIIRLRHARES
ncbi:hypothetical protein K2Q16_04490 [Patescibacteria group bacterium]|nr:hypothetical protein [Patescibacteria group bacterium]